MKVLKRLIVWIMISLIIQFAGLIFLNKFLVSNSSASVKKVAVVKSQPQKYLNISIDASASQLKMSYNGKYLSYTQNGTIKVTNTITGKSNEYKPEANAQVNYYKWLPDRNYFIVAEKESTKNSGTCIKLYNYNADDNAKERISNELHKVDTKIRLTDKASNVTDLLTYVGSNVTYVKITNSGKKSTIYKLNIMSEMEQVRTYGYTIGQMDISYISQNFLYEDLSGGKIRVDNGKTITINGAQRLGIIATDNNDNVYLGNIEKDGKIKTIYYGTIGENTSQWKKVQLDQAIEKNEIYVAPNSGKIYINDNLKGCVKEAASGKQTFYKGLFLQIFGKGVASTDDNKLVVTNFSEK